MCRSRARKRRALVLACAGAVACAGGRTAPERANGSDSESEARIRALKAELAASEARVEALEAERGRGAGGELPDVAPPFSQKGLTEQLRRLLWPSSLPESFEPGPTAWRDTEVRPRFARGGASGVASPGDLAVAVAREEGGASLGVDLWEATIRVLVADDERSASAAVLGWGFKDDAVEGEDIRLELRRGEDGWYVESAELRRWCRRGVTSDQNCL